MKRILLLFLIIFSYTFSFAQSDSCDINIPEICASHSLFEYPASTSGTAWAPAGPPAASFNCPGVGQQSMNPSFLFFEIGATGDFTMTIDPIDEFTGLLLSSPSDLDYVCWGPFSSVNACTQLQVPNRYSCSGSGAASETVTIPGAIAGEIYILLVSNYAAIGSTPPNANIKFTASTSVPGVNPLGGGGFAGSDYDIIVCSTDLPFNLIDQLQGFPDDWGYWVDSISGNLVDTTFNPSTDPAGVYLYIIPEGNSCGGDTASLEINVISASSISITSVPNSCSDDGSLTLTASPSGGIFSGTDVLGNIFTPSAGNIGLNIISYEYTANGCAPIIVTQDLTVNESPIVLPADAVTTNPSCFGDCNGTAIITPSLGLPPYNYDWGAADSSALCAGTFYYTVTDGNNCPFTDNVTLFDPINNLGVLTSYNSSCYGTNDGSISITMNGGTTPPGTVSLLSYCLSSTATDFFTSGGAIQLSAIIEEVKLNGDGNNINNNTAGVSDYYENYTTSMYADITEGQSYTVDLILGDISGTNSYPSGAKVFIDYNIDGDFDDTDELIGTLNGIGTSPNAGSINFIVPSTGAFGPTRMRVVSQDTWITQASSIGPCDYADPSITNDLPWFGATEDYSIVLNSPTIIASFLWEDGQTTSTINNLSPGNYTVTITPSIGGCSVQDSASILEPDEINFNPTITQISCNTFTDGQVVLNPSGGNGGFYTIDWGIANPLALSDGSYLVTVSDPSTITTTNLLACENDTIITLIDPQPFNVYFSVSDHSICLGDNIMLDFNFSNGITPFTINYTENGVSLSEGPINNTGTYSITASPSQIITNYDNIYANVSVTDSAGCINQNIVTSEIVNVNILPDINTSTGPNPICIGQNSSLNFNSISGIHPIIIDYNVTDVNGTALSNEIIGFGGLTLPITINTTTTYEIISLVDDSLCTNLSNEIEVITVNPLPNLTISTANSVCVGDTAFCIINFTAGTAPWNISYNVYGINNILSTSNTSDTIEIIMQNTDADLLINNLVDNNTCENLTIPINTITPNPLPIVTISGTGTVCAFDGISDIIITTTGGASPYTLDYNNGITSFSEIIGSPETLTTPNAGTYIIESIFDANNCSADLTSTNTITNVSETPELNTSYSTELCEGDPLVIDLNFTSGSPPFIIDYTFNGTATFTTVNNLQGLLSFVSTNPTNILLDIITSSNNCINPINEAITITLNPLPIATIIDTTIVLCEGGGDADILVVTTDGTPFYNIVYTNGTNIDSVTYADSSQTFKTNTSGVYSLLSVTDSKGCESINMNGFATVIINPLPDVAISAYPTQTEITDPLIYFQDRSSNHISGEWNFDDGQTQASNFNTINHIYSDTGTYQVSLTTVSIDSCVSKAYQTIIISPTFTIYIPNAFTPNNDLDNDYFMPILEGVQDFEMSIYDRQGQRIFNTTEYSNEYCIRGCNATWDGTVNNGEYGTIGVYIYHLIITDINGKVRNFEGPVTLIR